MSEYLKCPLCGAPLDQEAESDNTINMTCNKCGYTGPSIYKYSHWDIVAMQEEQNAIIAAALERARKGCACAERNDKRNHKDNGRSGA